MLARRVMLFNLLAFTSALGSTLYLPATDQRVITEATLTAFQNPSVSFVDIVEQRIIWPPVAQVKIHVANMSVPIWKFFGFMILAGLLAKTWQPLLRANERYWADAVHDY